MTAEIRRGIEELLALELSSWDRVASLGSLNVSAGFNAVALDPLSSYEDVYLAGLKLRQFNICLLDYSYLQLSVMGEGMRLAFYPNPFLMPDHLLELIEDPTDFDAFTIDELRATGSRSPLRYDVDPRAYRACAHPHSHFHLGHGELGRLACRRIFSAHSFCLLIAKLFFPDHWARRDLDGPDGAGFVNAVDVTLARLMRASGLIDARFFSEAEVSLPHVT